MGASNKVEPVFISKRMKTKRNFLRIIILGALLLGVTSQYAPAADGKKLSPDIIAEANVVDEIFTSGGRAALVYLPPNFEANKEHALLIALHGYSVDAFSIMEQLMLGSLVARERLIIVAPQGTVHPDLGVPFWNAMPSCCGFEDWFGPQVDDSSYLSQLVDDLVAEYPVDTRRIYFVGASNGGAMAYRFAIDHPEKITALVSLSGPFNYPEIDPLQPTSVLQVHGTDDPVIQYDGGEVIPGEQFTQYPGVHDVVAYWAERADCQGQLTTYGHWLDLTESIPGLETERQRYRGCSGNIVVELWTVHGGGHVMGNPTISEKAGTTQFTLAMWNWLRTQKSNAH